MSNSEKGYDEDDFVSLCTRFGTLVPSMLDTEQMHALQESVRKQKLEREEINEGQDSDESKEKSDIEKAVEETENSMESEGKSENDRIETTEKVATKEGKPENLLKGDVTQEYDTVETTEKLANKQGNDSPPVKNNKNIEEQEETDAILTVEFEKREEVKETHSEPSNKNMEMAL
jgi:hypothetical protein